jgi:hypothetical protein
MKRLNKRALTGHGRAHSGWLLTRAVLLVLLFSAGAARSNARTDEDEAARRHVTLRWDIATGPDGLVLPGGLASAFADDGSKITITGSGTFVESRIRNSRRCQFSCYGRRQLGDIRPARELYWGWYLHGYLA